MAMLAGMTLLLAGGCDGRERAAGARAARSVAETPATARAEAPPGAGTGGGAASSGAAGATGMPVVDSGAGDDPWTAYKPTTPGGARPSCPATGHWSPCGIMLRLDRAGVAPRVQPGDVREEPLRQSGRTVLLGTSELLVFIYSDSAARAADEARLDPRRYIDASANPTLRNEATIIRSDNLLAILRSRSETQRERVSLAITAGPAQARP